MNTAFEIRDDVARSPDVNRFFMSWKKRPSQEKFEHILKNSDIAVYAIDAHTGDVIGFATAITDHIFAGYITLLEVVPVLQRKGVGKALVTRLKERLGEVYMIDVVCDEDAVGFYEKLGMKRGIAMMRRNLDAL